MNKLMLKILGKSHSYGYFDRLAYWIHAKYLRKTGKILDAGAGTGIISRAWKNIGYSVSACDLFPTSKNIMKVNLNKKWPYGDDSFDYIFMWHVIEHLKNQDNWIHEAKRCLKNNGILILGCPDFKSYHKHFYDVYTHCMPYTVPLINDIAKSKKFDVIENRIFSNIPVLWKISNLSFKLVMPLKPKSIFAVLKNNK